AAHVRFGSLADIATDQLNVCFTPKSGHWNSVARCLLCAKSRHTEAPRGHPLDDCDVHSVQWVTSSSFCLSGAAFRAGYHPRTMEAAIGTMTQRAGKDPNSGHGRIQYDAQRHCAYELHS